MDAQTETEAQAGVETPPSPTGSSRWDDDRQHGRGLPAPASASKPGSTSGVCARESPQPHGYTKGTSAGSLSITLLPFPAGLAGCESAVSTVGLPGQPSIWEEGGSGSHTPRGRELRRTHGRAQRQAQRPSCSALLPYASIWPGKGGAEQGWEPSTGWAPQGSQLPQAAFVGSAWRSLQPGRSSPPGERPAHPSISSPATSGGDGVRHTGHSQYPHVRAASTSRHHQTPVHRREAVSLHRKAQFS